MGGLFVALGDSFTEGVGDYNPNFPNGVRGWADRVAKQLGKQDPDFRYANLAVRSKRLHQIVADQLEPAIAMQPTLVSFYAGGNDILEFKRSMPELLAEYESAIRRLSETGARLILFTGFEVMLPPVLEPMRRRNWTFNEAVRELSRRYDAVLVDHWAFERDTRTAGCGTRTGCTCPRWGTVHGRPSARGPRRRPHPPAEAARAPGAGRLAAGGPPRTRLAAGVGDPDVRAQVQGRHPGMTTCRRAGRSRCASRAVSRSSPGSVLPPRLAEEPHRLPLQTRRLPNTQT